MVQVLLVTCDAWPEGEPGAGVLDAAFAERGVSTRWVSWRDSSVDWQAADAVAVRSTWDYANHREEFLAWARSVGPTLLNGVDLFTWNTDKAYLAALAAAEVPIVPTILVDGEEDLPAAVAEFERAVVKPAVGAGGRGVVIFDGPDSSPDGLGSPPWIVQPLVESVRTEGEISVFVLGGDPVSQVVKRPAGGEIRVHERYGGATYAAELTDEAGSLAVLTIRAAEKLLGTTLAYGRVDMMRMPDGRLVVSELEATEPGLYLEFLPGNGAAFADMVAARLAD